MVETPVTAVARLRPSMKRKRSGVYVRYQKERCALWTNVEAGKRRGVLEQMRRGRY